MDSTILPENDNEKTDTETPYAPPETDSKGRFVKGNSGGPGVPKRRGKDKSYRDVIPLVAKRIVDIINRKDDSWIEKMKETHPSQLLVWSTQLLRTCELLDAKAGGAGVNISNQIAAMDEETLNARIQTMANQLKGDSTYYETNTSQEATVRTLRDHVVELETELAELKSQSPTVVIEKPSPKSLPTPDVHTEPKQLPEADANFDRMANMDEDDPDYRSVWK